MSSVVFDFTGQVVIVTGACGNLGHAVSHRFLDAGAHLVLVDRAGERLANCFPQLSGSAGHLLLGGVDATSAAAMQGAAAAARRRFGRIDTLVNTVGGYRAGDPLHETPLDTWDFMLNQNARSVFISSQAVIPAMLEQRSGQIINVAARSALAGTANAAAYSAAKSAVVRLTESMAAELRREGLNVNCVLPGRIDTPQNRAAFPDADASRWVPPEAIADVILFLASPAARAIHGAAIPVYGLS